MFLLVVTFVVHTFSFPIYLFILITIFVYVTYSLYLLIGMIFAGQLIIIPLTTSYR